MDNKENFMKYVKQRIKKIEFNKKKRENEAFDYHIKSVQRASNRRR
ncbi:hypothetical protein SAMN05444401_1746 [Clostridium amylolyticum]|uniref:Uncharacterized protein n=1 Tax=Clostridium amylolyticum TaxID=1121298 RepID=A0A1M6EYY8_9CLOT|nr:hypothetical protein SAMN05444401_1746 [Clostridium amylolyticum]